MGNSSHKLADDFMLKNGVSITRKQQFINRESRILEMAEQLLLESGEGNLTLDSLALQLDLAKGTLYKHFASKDELLLRLLINYERKMLAINDVGDGAAAGVARIVLQLLNLPQRAVLFNQIEERLSAVASGQKRLFAELYRIRRERMARGAKIVEAYLLDLGSGMMTRDYLSTLYAVGQGGASLLNSSFYQRYLGSRDSLKLSFVKQMLELPRLYPACDGVQAEQNQADAIFHAVLSRGHDDSQTLKSE